MRRGVRHESSVLGASARWRRTVREQLLVSVHATVSLSAETSLTTLTELFSGMHSAGLLRSYAAATSCACEASKPTQAMDSIAAMCMLQAVSRNLCNPHRTSPKITLT
jgi:hypothetical protein